MFPLLFVYMKKIKQLDIFIDESDDFSHVSKTIRFIQLLKYKINKGYLIKSEARFLAE